MADPATMTTSTALVLNEINGPFSFETIRLDPLRPTEALVEIHASGICHTDLSCAEGSLPAKTPAVLGHEGNTDGPGKPLLISLR